MEEDLGGDPISGWECSCGRRNEAEEQRCECGRTLVEGRLKLQSEETGEEYEPGT